MLRIRISLANKCQLLFGGAVVLIVCAALAVPWLRMATLVSDAQREIARELAQAYLADQIQLGDLRSSGDPQLGVTEDQPRSLRLVMEEEFGDVATRDTLIASALSRFSDPDGPRDILVQEKVASGQVVYRYIRAVRQSDLERFDPVTPPAVGPSQISYKLRAIVLINMRADWADRQLLLNRVYTVIAGLLAVLLAIAVFWFITTRLILSPVRVLRDTAGKVAEGDLSIRSDINTGDEFEHLGRTFNTMLGNLKNSQDELRELNRQLDLKLGELSASNVTLFESNRVKNEFLANVSHELRTPLNSIIGFAELLAESLGGTDAPADDKRRRYLENILTSGKSLLQLITDLLDLAKIEAGRVDLHVERVVMPEVCEVLLNLIRPQADRKGIELKLSVPRRMPVVETDAGKFQQIIFNFLSNAVKFTPAGGSIELGAEVLGDEEETHITGMRIWVKDTGPGIAAGDQKTIFEKFHQLDPSHTREHGGTGLGLAISSELARLLQARIELNSAPGLGSTFSLIIPITLHPESHGPLLQEATKEVGA